MAAKPVSNEPAEDTETEDDGSSIPREAKDATRRGGAASAWNGEPEGLLSDGFTSRQPLFTAGSPTRDRAAEPPRVAPPWKTGETGSVLERELLLVNAEDASSLEPSGRRGIKALALLFLLALLVAGALFGLHRLERGWSNEMDSLKSRLGHLEAEGRAQKRALEQATSETSVALDARKRENRSLALIVEKSLEELERAVGDLERLEHEKDRLESDYRTLKQRSEAAAGADWSELIGKLYPSWLRLESAATESDPQE